MIIRPERDVYLRTDRSSNTYPYILSMTGWASFEEYQIKTGDCNFIYIKDGVVFKPFR